MTQDGDSQSRTKPLEVFHDSLIRVAARKGRGDTCAIAIMAKASRPGLVKTRLAPPLSSEQAACLNTAFLADIVDNLLAAGRDIEIAPYLAFGPPGSASFFEERFSNNVGLIEIWFADFGMCLFRTLQYLLDLGYGAACVLNSDSPTLPTVRLVEAATKLLRPGDRAVLGPSTDGGYYILGVKTAHRRLFEDIAWSTEIVADQTVQRAQEIGLELVTLAPWYDVDDAETLRQLSAELASNTRLNDTEAHYAAPHTKAAIHGLLAESSLAITVIPSAESAAPPSDVVA